MMLFRFVKALAPVVGLALAALGFGQGNITVVTPTEGSVLGLSNNVVFNITGASTKVNVAVTLTNVADSTKVVSNNLDFTNITDGKIQNGTIPLNLDTSLPEGAYVLTVVATEQNNTYNTPAPINVTVVLKAPKFLDFSPINGSYVKGDGSGNVNISCSFRTNNLKKWEVTVNGSLFTNSSGTPSNTSSVSTPDGTVWSFAIPWNVNGITTDGAETIKITLTDTANNVVSQTMSVTLDRQPPSITVNFPRSDTVIVAHSRIPFVIDISDSSASSVDFTGIDVVLQDSTGHFLLRVPRQGVAGVNSTTLRWTGRVRPAITLPSRCQLVVTAVDKAGNVATSQTVVLTVN